MSDEFSECSSSFKRQIALNQPEIRYAAKADVNEVIFAVDIPFPLLKEWHKILASSRAEGTSGQNFSTGSRDEQYGSTENSRKIDYVDLLEHCIPCGLFAFTDDESIRNEISVHLSKLAGTVVQLYKKTKGRARKDLDEKVKKFHVCEGQVKSVREFHEEMESMRDEIKEWKAKHKDLEEATKEIYQEMIVSLTENRKVIEELQKSNRELENYITVLEEATGISAYKGKQVSEAKQKARTLKCFLSRAETALWFSKSFGLELDSLNVKELDTGVIHNLQVSQESRQNAEGSKYSNLPEQDKEKIEQILFLLDKFCVGDAFYHELTMIFDGLPRSYLVKQCRDDLNKMCHLDPLQGKHIGAKVSSVEALFQEHIQDYLHQNPSFSTDDKIQIKINGDGARMTRNSNFILLSFSILQTEQSVMSAKGNRTIAVVNASEGYQTLKESFGGIFGEINQLIASGKLAVNGKEVNTEFFLGGDYKFILLMLGLKGATSNYACAWCKIHKSERWKIEENYSTYNMPPLARSLEEINKMCSYSKDNYCCDKKPLLNIELDHIVVDELHLMLRVTDILTENIITECLNWDKDDDLNRKKGEPQGLHLKKLIQVIRSCGVSFDVWEQRNADGKASGKYDWTSLLGTDKKILLEALLDKLKSCLRPQTSDAVVKVWKGFGHIYGIVNNWAPDKDPNDFFS